MKKYIFILFLTLFSYPVFSQNETFDVEKFKKDIHEQSLQKDTVVQAIKDITSIIKDEVKTHGIKKTIQINSPILLPAVIFLILYLIWLKGRNKE